MIINEFALLRIRRFGVQIPTGAPLVFEVFLRLYWLHFSIIPGEHPRLFSIQHEHSQSLSIKTAVSCPETAVWIEKHGFTRGTRTILQGEYNNLR
jgi:hypothetical protein